MPRAKCDDECGRALRPEWRTHVTKTISADAPTGKRKLSASQERALLAFGDLGRPLFTYEVQRIMRLETMWVLERKGYAHFSTYGVEHAQKWILTTPGRNEYARLKGGQA